VHDEPFRDPSLPCDRSLQEQAGQGRLAHIRPRQATQGKENRGQSTYLDSPHGKRAHADYPAPSRGRRPRDIRLEFLWPCPHPILNHFILKDQGQI
jgi:hypothetical protein